MAPGSDGGFPVCLLTSACQESNRPLTFLGFYSHRSHNWCGNQLSAGSPSYATSKCKRLSAKQIEESQTMGVGGGTGGWEWIYSFWLSLCIQHRLHERIFLSSFVFRNQTVQSAVTALSWDCIYSVLVIGLNFFWHLLQTYLLSSCYFFFFYQTKRIYD